MMVDGRAIAGDCIRALQEGEKPKKIATLTIISVAPTFVTLKYLRIKEKIAEEIGVTIHRIDLPHTATSDEVIDALHAAHETTGIVLQLPFPAHIDTSRVLSHLPLSQDVDVIGHDARAAYEKGALLILPPVVGAIAHIAHHHHVPWKGANVTVVGAGKLVGAPAALFAERKGSIVRVVTKKDSIHESLQGADILILGAGSPGIITPSMIKEGVMIFDAGTSEESGKLVGDADPLCRSRASLMTPVPGGIGPVAVAKLFENVLLYANAHTKD
jgi:methylenetetrahydrofolate dehydrogenase (NADP+) / methenyltetrahydrofolate cyclohydrolase